MHDIFYFILFYRITYDRFYSIKIKITAFDRLGFMFVRCIFCIVVIDVSIKERHFADDLIHTYYFVTEKDYSL